MRDGNAFDDSLEADTGLVLAYLWGMETAIKSIQEHDKAIVLAYLWGMETKFHKTLDKTKTSFSLPMRDGNPHHKGNPLL